LSGGARSAGGVGSGASFECRKPLWLCGICVEAKYIVSAANAPGYKIAEINYGAD